MAHFYKKKSIVGYAAKSFPLIFEDVLFFALFLLRGFEPLVLLFYIQSIKPNAQFI